MNITKGDIGDHAGFFCSFDGDECPVFWGCRFIPNKDNFTIKSIITATYDGKPVEGTAVLYQRYDYKPTNYTRGEATVLHLGDNKRAYLLTTDRYFRHLTFKQYKNFKWFSSFITAY